MNDILTVLFIFYGSRLLRASDLDLLTDERISYPDLLLYVYSRLLINFLLLFSNLLMWLVP